LGGSLCTLPGAAFLAIPFVLLGNSAYSNIFWLFVFFKTVESFLKDRFLTLLLLWVMLLFSPVVLQQIVTGNSELSNALYFFVFTFFLVKLVPQSDTPGWVKWIVAISFGISLSSRANFLLLLPVIFSALAQKAGLKSTVPFMLLSCLAFLVITVPFYLYDPSGFSALHSQFHKVAQFQSLLPFLGVLIPLGGGLLALGLSFRRMDFFDFVNLFTNCAFVLSFSIVCVTVLSTIQTGELNFSWTGYGIFFLFFGAVASWSHLVKDRIDPVPKIPN